MLQKHPKLREWIRRYLPAEIIATFTALTSAVFVHSVSNSFALAAVAGTIGENIGYYGYFIAKEALIQHKNHKHFKFFHRTVLVFSKTTRNLLVEFGPAEALDSLIVRPVAMFVVPQLINPFALGILVGKLSADLVFYCFAILGYEARKRWFKD